MAPDLYLRALFACREARQLQAERRALRNMRQPQALQMLVDGESALAPFVQPDDAASARSRRARNPKSIPVAASSG
jgi:hypothetical protein